MESPTKNDRNKFNLRSIDKDLHHRRRLIIMMSQNAAGIRKTSVTSYEEGFSVIFAQRTQYLFSYGDVDVTYSIIR